MKNNKYSFTWLGRLLIYLITIPFVILIYVLLINTELSINSSVLMVLTFIAWFFCVEGDFSSELVIRLLERIINHADLLENKYIKHILKIKKV